jgi:myosin heavy subunit
MSEEEGYTETNIDLGSFENKIQQVANEIDQLKNSFSKSTEDLSRIKNMLDMETFKDVTSTIERFEGLLNEANRQKEEAYQGAKKYSQELEKEKERLIKLWDAYKKQEEELSQTESKIQGYEKQVNKFESEKKELEQQLTQQINTLQEKLNTTDSDLQQLNEYKTKINEYTTKCQTLEQEKQTLKSEVDQQKTTISDLQQQNEKLKNCEQYSQYKDKYGEVTKAYEKEKDRLTKLYHLYEETEQEVNRLKKENDHWQNWYNSNKDIFNKLFTSAPPTPKPANKPDITPTNPPPELEPIGQQPTHKATEQDTPSAEGETKQKKKGFFRK